MGILKDYNGQSEGSYVGRKELCKPDYEDMIKTARLRMTKAVKLKAAIFFYIEERSVSDALSTMVGELSFEIRNLHKTVERLIEQQEHEK